MTVTPAGPGVRSFPAPGSTVPGAPPRLKRALTPADGDPQMAAPDHGDTATQTSAAPAIPSPTGGYTAAVAMLGIAAGLELSQLFKPRRHSGRQK